MSDVGEDSPRLSPTTFFGGVGASFSAPTAMSSSSGLHAARPSAGEKRPRLVSSPFVTLYSSWRSSSSYRVRIGLNWKRIQYTCKAVHLIKGGGIAVDSDYSAINPMKEVPTLLIHGHTLTQSTAILEYIEETYPERPLLPRTNPYLRSIVRELCNVISNDIQPLGNLRVLNRVGSFFPPEERFAKKEEWLRHFITLGFEGLEALLRKSAGRYCVGDQVTMADVFLVPQVFNATHFGIDMRPYPTIVRVNTALQDLPEFRLAAPEAQTDAPEPQMRS